MPQINNRGGLRSAAARSNDGPVEALVDGDVWSRAGTNRGRQVTANLRELRWHQHAGGRYIENRSFVERLIRDNRAMSQRIDADGVRHWCGACGRSARWSDGYRKGANRREG